VKALALRESGDRACGGISGTDADDGIGVLAKSFDLEVGPKCTEPDLVDGDFGREVAALAAKDDDTCVKELLSLDAGDDAEDCVVKGDWHERAWPPLRRWILR